MRYAEIIREGRDAPLYIATGLYAAEAILSDGHFTTRRTMSDYDHGGDVEEDRYVISTTRDPRLRYYENGEGNDSHGAAPIQFVLDQTRIAQRFKIHPFDFWDGRHRAGHDEYAVSSAHESEERVETQELSTDYVVAIMFLPLNEMFYRDISSDDEHYLQDGRVPEEYYDRLFRLASSRGIKVVDKRGLHENATAGATSAASIAVVPGGLGSGFDPNGHKGIYQDSSKKKRKAPLIRR